MTAALLLVLGAMAVVLVLIRQAGGFASNKIIATTTQGQWKIAYYHTPQDVWNAALKEAAEVARDHWRYHPDHGSNPCAIEIAEKIAQLK